MNSPFPRSRRALLRGLVLGTLAAVIGLLVRRRQVRTTCTGAGLCRRCERLPGCDLPLAVTMRRPPVEARHG